MKYTLFELRPKEGELDTFDLVVSFDENPLAVGGTTYVHRGLSASDLNEALTAITIRACKDKLPKCPHCNQPIESQQ